MESRSEKLACGSKLVAALEGALAYVISRDYRGIDPYDGVSSVKSERILDSKYLNAILTQFHKRSRLNIRGLVGIHPSLMPKSLGIVLNAISVMRSVIRDKSGLLQNVDLENESKKLLFMIEECRVHTYSGAAWNFGFHYKHMGHNPTVVITAIVCRGLNAYAKYSGDERAYDLIRSASSFVLNDLVATEFPQGICYSYTPQKADCCYNASMFAAEILSMAYSIDNDRRLLEPIERAVNFVLEKQHPDGKWCYSMDMKTGRERHQIDFHQGYVLESLYRIRSMTSLGDEKWESAILKGTEFYLNSQLFDRNKMMYRWPKKYPIDIHNQAQAIILLSLFSRDDPGKLDIAEAIGEWTIQNMQGSDGGFSYKLYLIGRNSIPYMRWSQVWMVYALAELLTARETLGSQGRAEPVRDGVLSVGNGVPVSHIGLGR